MKIEDIKVYEGRNIYSHKKCVKMIVNLEGYSDIPSKNIENFNTRLLEWVPELREHKCCLNIRGGFVKRLEEGTYLAHIMEHMVIALQNKLGLELCYGKAREIEGELYYIVFQYIYKETALETARVAVNVINSIILNKNYDIKIEIDRLQCILKEEQLGASTLSIINEAHKRGIPAIRISDGSMFQLGYGKNSKLIEATITLDTSAIAVDISCDKLITKELLHNQFIPIAEGCKVNNPIDLLLKAKDIGYPVVLKPRYGNQGKSVFVNIKNEKELMRAFSYIIKKYKDIIIEKHIQGRDFRVLLVDGEVVAVSERIPPNIMGDGLTTIKELIRTINLEGNRGDGHEKALTKVSIDEGLISCISKKGYTLASIIEKGEKLFLRDNANLSTGGSAVDCTDIICRENIDICKRSAETIGLDICGIDICCMDISKSINNSGAVIEVNSAPGIRMHHYPLAGDVRNVASSIVDMMVKNGLKTIPVISVTGTNGKTTTTRLISNMMQRQGYDVGMTTTGGIYINNQCIEKGDTTGYNSAMTILRNKKVEAAVLETARGGIIKKGLAYDLADVAVITNITEDHLGIDGIETMEELSFVKALVGEAVKESGYVVINADDEYSISITGRIKSNIIMFSVNKENKYVIENISKGGYGIYIENECVVIAGKGKLINLIKIKDIKIAMKGSLIYNIENAMAAIGSAMAIGVSYENIVETLFSFDNNELNNPGRFNTYSINGTTVILDYGHNIQGYKAVLKSIKNFKYNNLIGIIGVPGDRSDKTIKELGVIAGENFDYIYIKEDIDKRGRKSGEVADKLNEGIKTTGFNKNKTKIILNEVEALHYALRNCEQQDLIVVFFENREALVDVINQCICEVKEPIVVV